MTSWTVEHAWRCERHGWNTCPLTPAALRFASQPCCADAVPIASRSVAVSSMGEQPAAPPDDPIGSGDIVVGDPEPVTT